MPDYSKYQWNTKVGVVKHGGKVGGVSLDTSLLDAMIAEVQDKAASIIEDAGGEILKNVLQNVPVDTGELASSYLSESGMVSKYMYRIQDGVPYGIFQELGTSKMAAQPHVVPAVEAGEEELITGFAELFK